MGRIITLTGPSGSGKTTIVDFFLSIKKEGFHPVSIPKYTTRTPRDMELLGQKRNRNKEKIFVDKIPLNCDLVYETYALRYGLSSKRLYSLLEQGKFPIVILNDIRIVEDVRSTFSGNVCSVFIFRESPILERHQMLANERGNVSADEIWKRFLKAQSIYRIFIENIHFFDHVILNCGELSYLKRQVESIVDGLLIENFWPLFN
jgi:guanylate kinase